MEPTPFRDRLLQSDLEEDNRLIAWIRARLPELSGNGVQRLIQTGKILIDGGAVTAPTYALQAGQIVEFKPNAPRVDRAHRFDTRILHLDAQLVVADKPVGILTIPFAGDHDTLLNRVKATIPRIEKKGVIPPLRAVHRLDKECSGSVVFARTVPAQRGLQAQFAARTVKRHYRALVFGDVPFESKRIESLLVKDRGDGLKGSAPRDSTHGKPAITHFKVLERFSTMTLLECRLETGRTHQIRIHIAEAGHPIVGEAVYIRDYRGKRLPAPRLMLHAVALGFLHPSTGEGIQIESQPPATFLSYMAQVRRGDPLMGEGRQGSKSHRSHR